MSGLWGNITSSVVSRLATPQAPGKLQEHLDPHKTLCDVLHDLPVRSGYSFNHAAHGTLLRYLFNTVYCRAEWIPFLLPDDEPVPLPRDAESWAWREGGEDRVYSLSQTQRDVNAQRLEGGKSPTRPILRGKVCGKMIKRSDRTYTCRTCALDSSCVLCVDCFRASDHEGHEVLFNQSYSFSSTCDCGDQTAWKPEGVLGCAHHPRNPPDQPPAEHTRDFLTDYPNIPPALIQSIYQTLAIVLDYIIMAMQFAPLSADFGRLPADEVAMRKPEPTTGVARLSRGNGPWSVVIWGDDRHTIKEVTRQIRDACGIPWEQAEEWAREVDELGRKVIITTPDAKLAFHVASMFQQIDISVCLRPAYDTFREEVAGALLSWVLDISHSAVGLDQDLVGRLLWRALNESRREDTVHGGTGVPADLYDLAQNKARRIDWLLMEDPRFWRKAKFDLRSIYSRLYCVDWEMRRDLAVRLTHNYVRLFEHFITQDRELDSGLLFGISYMIFGNGPACAYACRKARLFDIVLDVAQSWFTGQARAGQLVIPPEDVDRSDPLTIRIVPEQFPAFRGKKGGTIFGHIRSLLRHNETQILIGSNPVMFNRACQLLEVFCGMQSQRKERNEHVEFEVDWPRTFTFLGDLAKASKELGESLRYSDKPHALLSNISNVGLRVWNDIQLNSNILDPAKYSKPRGHIVHNLFVPGSKTTLIENDMMVIDAFSFHHYMNLLLAEAYKAMGMLQWRRIEQDMGDGLEVVPVTEVSGARGEVELYTPTGIIEEIVLYGTRGDQKELDKLLLMEFPLQKHAILSHIRADLWRKNGAGMRGQAHHYRDIQNRDATIDQEFFFLQASLCTIRPLTFFSALADRYGVAEFFSLHTDRPEVWDDPQIEPRQYVQILEDFMMLCISLVTDQSAINGWTTDQYTRKYIVQVLGLGPLTFSDLMKKLPEKTTDGSVLPFLVEMADFKEPTDTAAGSYTLKSELVESIDPYWRHYSRNEQRRAVDRILDHRKKDKNDDTLILPPPITHPNPDGPWYNIHHWMSEQVAHEIIHYAVAHCGPIANPEAFPGLEYVRTDESMPSFDLLLDLALQLIMLILSYDAKTFSLCSVQSHPISGSLSTFQNLWLMQTTEAFKPYKAKADYIMSIIVQNVPEAYMREYHEQEAIRKQAEAAIPKPDARIAAAERQKQIMKDFAKQQASFAAALLDEEDDMEEDEVEAVPEETYGSCIVCQEDVTPSHTGGLLALFQPSRIMREAVPDRDWFEESVLAPSSLDQATRYHRYGLETTGEPLSTDGYPAANHRFGVIVSACSHLMHESCMAHYFDATRYRHTQQVQRHHPENAARYEYLCPLCKSLGNMLVPLDSTVTRLKSPITARAASLSDKIREVSSEGLLKIRESAKIWDHHVETGELVPWFSDCSFHTVSLDPTFRREVKTTAKMIERFRSLVRPLSEQSQRLRNRKTHMYVPDDVIAYTVSTTEIALRGLPTTGQSVAEQVPETSMTLIKKLIGLMQLELDLYFGPRWDRTALRVGLFARFLPDWYRASTLPSPLLLRNPLVLVVETAAIAPDLLQAVIHMAFFAELTRTMLGINMWIKRCLSSRTNPQPRSSPPADPGLAEALNLFRGLKPIMRNLLRNNAGPFTDTENVLSMVSDETLAKIMYSHTLPFLRRCAIIFYSVAGQYPRTDPASSGCEYARLLHLLGIPEPVPVLSNPQATETPIVARWLNQWAMQGRVVPSLEYPGTYELLRLPHKWEDMMNRYSETKCETCGTRPNFPALCLFCGALVCLAGDCCAEGEQGECNIHMRSCGAVVGLFVDIKRWLVVYLYAGSGSFGHMPYLDSHGELDISMRRGHRQYMHVGRMDELRRTTWLQHMIPHLTARKLELTSDGGGWGSL